MHPGHKCMECPCRSGAYPVNFRSAAHAQWTVTKIRQSKLHGIIREMLIPLLSSLPQPGTLQLNGPSHPLHLPDTQPLVLHFGAQCAEKGRVYSTPNHPSVIVTAARTKMPPRPEWCVRSGAGHPLLRDAVDVAGVQEHLARLHPHHLVARPIRLLQLVPHHHQKDAHIIR